MSFWNRIKVSCVLWAIFLLVAGILDAFVQIETLHNLIFHSIAFYLVLTATFFLVAPLLVRTLGLKLSEGSQNENA